MIQLTVRLPDDLHTKIKVIAAYNDTAINSILIGVLQTEIDRWEKQNGPLLDPDKHNE